MMFFATIILLVFLLRNFQAKVKNKGKMVSVEYKFYEGSHARISDCNPDPKYVGDVQATVTVDCESDFEAAYGLNAVVCCQEQSQAEWCESSVTIGIDRFKKHEHKGVWSTVTENGGFCSGASTPGDNCYYKNITACCGSRLWPFSTCKDENTLIWTGDLGKWTLVSNNTLKN